MATSNNIIFNSTIIKPNLEDDKHEVKNDEYIKEFNLKAAMDNIWSIISYADMTIQKNEPFKMIKTNREQAVIDIQALLYDLFVISKLLSPFLPRTAEIIKDCVLNNKMPDQPLFLRK